MNLSICIVAKNEENYIEDCILSVHDIADEIIFTDTGSTDRTIEIALKYPKVKLFHDEWIDESVVRNNNISNASSNWILVLDADERLREDTQKKILAFLEENKTIDHKNVFCFLTVNNFDSHSKYYFKSTLFKNHEKIKYIRPIHSQIYTENVNYINLSEMIINHVYKDDIHNLIKIEMYINKLKDIISKNKDYYDNWYYYKHLGDAFFSLNKIDEALDSYRKSNELYNTLKFDMSKDKTYPSNLNKISKILVFSKKEYQKAIPYLYELIALSPDTIDGYYHLAICEQYNKNISKSIFYYQKAYENALKKPNTFVVQENIKNSIKYLKSLT